MQSRLRKTQRQRDIKRLMSVCPQSEEGLCYIRMLEWSRAERARGEKRQSKALAPETASSSVLVTCTQGHPHRGRKWTNLPCQWISMKKTSRTLTQCKSPKSGDSSDSHQCFSVVHNSWVAIGSSGCPVRLAWLFAVQQTSLWHHDVLCLSELLLCWWRL